MTARPVTAARFDPAIWAAAGLLGAALLLGVAAPYQLVAELGGAVLFAWWALRAPSALLAVPGRVWLLAALLVALPLLQLVPLPPAVWQALPGRALEHDALALIGAADSWRALSLTPSWTVASAVQMTMAAAVLVMSSALPRRGRAVVLLVIVAAALLSLAAGIEQVAGIAFGGDAVVPGAGQRFLLGFQAYHNDEALLLLIALLALAALASDQATAADPLVPRRYLLGGLALGGVLLVLGVVLSASRTGMLLLVPTLLAAWLILRPMFPRRAGRIVPVAIALGSMALLAAVLVRENPTLLRAVGRFAATEESRPEIWHQAMWLAHNTFPWGGGLGSFYPLFLGAEPLEAVGELLPDYAHNDYLQLLIEGGLPGLGVFAAAVWLVGGAAWQQRRHPAAGSRGQFIFALATLGLLALHSLVDFPLRSLSLACIAALCAGLLMSSTVFDTRGEG